MKNGPVIRIGVSACLMGRACRYNGTAKRCDWASVGTEDAGVVWLPFCPEQAAGLGTPRPPIELVGRDAVAALLDPPGIYEVASRRDVTAALRGACAQQADRWYAFADAPDAFLLKARSPSCGRCSPLHDWSGQKIGTAPGEWARTLSVRFPGTPVFTEEELPALAAWIAQKRAETGPAGGVCTR